MDFLDRPSVAVTFQRPPSPSRRVRFNVQPAVDHPPTPARKKRRTKDRLNPSQQREPTKSTSKPIRVPEPSQGSHPSSLPLPNSDACLEPFALRDPDQVYETRYPDTPPQDDVHFPDQDERYFDSSSLNDAIKDVEFSYFVDAVESEECAFMQLSTSIFVANGWNRKKAESTSAWYHIQSTKTSTGWKSHCMCNVSDCFHLRYLAEYREDKFASDAEMPEMDRHIYMCSRYEGSQTGVYVTTFSVPPSTGIASTVKQRAIVVHEGDEKGGGTWTCSKDRGALHCPHIMKAKDSLQQHLQADAGAHSEERGHMDTFLYDASPPNRQGILGDISVSYLPLPPPKWARLKTDAPDPNLPTFVQSGPQQLIVLTDTSTCCCHSPRSLYDPGANKITRECTIYGIGKATRALIQLQRCPLCVHRYVGPDGQDIGLFNFNNRVLFTLDLLDDYISQYTTSETPFVAWVTSVTHRYSTRGSQIPFVNDKVFRAAWFSYIRLVQLDSDMICSKCGPNPDATIWDRVTLAFNKRNLRSNLCPPTTIVPNAPVKDDVRSRPGLQFLVDKKLRTEIRETLKGPKLHLATLSDGDAGGDTDTSSYNLVSNSCGSCHKVKS